MNGVNAMWYMQRKLHQRQQQRGAVLFVALVFLILLTLLALTATSTSILQERMTGGMRNQQLGFMGAETVVRGGETFLWGLSFDGTQPLPPCITGMAVPDCVYRPTPSGHLDSVVQTFRTSKTWIESADGGRDYPYPLTALTGAAETASLHEQPRFLLENLGPNRPPGSGQQKGTRDPEGRSIAGSHEWYRVTGRSQGGSGAVMRAIESVYSALDLTNTGINPDAVP